MRAIFLRLNQLPKLKRFILASLIFLGAGLFIFGISYQLKLIPLRMNGVETQARVIDISQTPASYTGTEQAKTWYTLSFEDAQKNVQTFSQTRPDKLDLNDTVNIVYNERLPSEFIDAHVLDHAAGTQLLWSVVGGMMMAVVLLYLFKSSEKQ